MITKGGKPERGNMMVLFEKSSRDSSKYWKTLWNEFKTKRNKILVGILIWVIILIVFHLLARVGALFSLERPITWNVDSFEESVQSIVFLILSPFIHLDFVTHLSFNLLGLILVLIPFMTYYGIRKSSFYLFFIGITTRILGLIIHQISVIGIELLIILNNRNISFSDSLTVYNITIGVSGMVMAIVGFFLAMTFFNPSEYRMLFFKNENSFWDNFSPIYASISLLVLVLVIVIDTNNYLAVYGEWFQFVGLGEIIIDFHFTFGNYNFGHLLGFILGCLLGCCERIKMNRNSTVISVKKRRINKGTDRGDKYEQ